MVVGGGDVVVVIEGPRPAEAGVPPQPGGSSDTLLSEKVRFILRNDDMVGRAHDGGRLTRVEACLRTAVPPFVVAVDG